ncbi:Predicted Zn-dependent peptidase [Chitinophaga costaii]|uniref:Predicted Zn-dependent peptidase n=1 Tax=Chitinophaga costaii TaxID=1335309 RepID=A0A1C4G5C1_9BACT|nr:pitrilysin family protein [Chitinophaga costaii]PUZ22048.1 insulinase family protein [Chitinophaga costaii]SCC63055.1 Predicted Zn-dependent peptidase [Chitinophaga costaii]
MQIRYKFSFLLAMLLSASTLLQAQKKEAYETTVDGVKVIVQPSNNDIVEIRTIIKGGVQNYPANKAGIENLAFTALTECGTAKDDKNSWKNKLDKVSAQVSGTAGQNFATLGLNCIKSDLETVWPLYVDALITPRFDKKEFDRVRQDAINSLKAQASEPDYAIEQLAKKTAFAGKDYAKDPAGTEATVAPLTDAETKAYYNSILTRSRMLIVVVGDVDRANLEAKLKAMLDKVPQGAAFSLKKELYTPKANTFKSEKRDVATNYIQGVTSAPLPGTPDFNAFQLAMRIFYDRHFLNVRTKNGLSYAPGAYFDGTATASGNITVSTTDPNRYISVAQRLIDSTKQFGFSEEEVKDMKSFFVTRFYYSEETNGAQAASLATNEILHNNWRRALTLHEDVKKLTVKDINNAFNKYISHITWVYQGDTTKVDPNLFIHPKTLLPNATLNSSKQ